MPHFYGDYRDVAMYSIRVTAETLSGHRIVTTRGTLENAMKDLAIYIRQFPQSGGKLKIMNIRLVENIPGGQDLPSNQIFPARYP